MLQILWNLVIRLVICITSWITLLESLHSKSGDLIILLIDLGKPIICFRHSLQRSASHSIKLASFVLFWNSQYLHPQDSWFIYPEVICQWTDPLQPLSLGTRKGEREVVCLLESDATWASHTCSMGYPLPLAIRQNRTRCQRALFHNWSHSIN